VTLKAILWDFDGTLIFFNIDAPRMRREIFEYMTRRGYQPPNDGRWRSIFNIIKDAKEFFLNAGKSAEDINAFASHVEEIINTIEAEGTGTARVVPGIPEVLQQTHQWGIKHAIITLNRGKNVTQLLAQLGLIQYFDVIAGRDVVAQFKPDPAHTHYILNRLHLKPEDCLMIGDHPNDLDTAKAAGVPFAAVITDRHPKAEFAGAQFFVQQEQMQETLSFIRSKL
jgi:phosphoglycolate phosphatase